MRIGNRDADRSPPQRVVWLLVFFMAALDVGCQRGLPPETILDLAEGSKEASITTETDAIDFGTERARSQLGTGWYYDERNRSTGDTFVWSRGSASELFFNLGWRRDLSLEVRGRPFEFPDAAGQTIAFELNSKPVGGPLLIHDASPALIVELPAELQVVGRNRLVARYGRTDAPATVVEGATDERELAFAWSEVRFVGATGGDVVAEPGRLTIPAGSRVDFFLMLPPGSVFFAEACEPVGESTTGLTLELLTEDGALAETYETACSGESVRYSLGDHGTMLTRLRLQTGPGAVRLVSGEVLAPIGGAEITPTPPGPLHSSRTNPPNVIIYLVDALRSDRLGVYGCDRPLSPCLDAMAEDGIVYTDMTAQSSWTKAAVASIFTGIWPRAHGVNGPDDRLPEDLPTLPERLHEAGYRTGAVVANAYVGRPFGFARGFDHFEYLEHGEGRSDAIGSRVERWLKTLSGDDAPFFLYVHAIDPHAPYAPPDDIRRRIAPEVDDPTVGRVEIVRGIVLETVKPTPELGRDLRDLYDAEVATNDASFGRLLDFLDARGLLEETLVVFTSDHGEAFGEHGSWTHGLDLYNEVLSVPLVVRLPGGADAARRVTAPVQHIDLLPSILSRCGIGGSESLPGVHLFDENGILPITEDRAVFSYLDYWGKHGAAVIRNGWKLIEPLSADFSDSRELYRRDVDVAENRNLEATNPVRSGWLGAQLGSSLRTKGRSVAADVDPAVRKQLEALGYMH